MLAEGENPGSNILSQDFDQLRGISPAVRVSKWRPNELGSAVRPMALLELMVPSSTAD